MKVLIAAFIILLSFTCHAQEVKIIRLKQQQMTYRPAGFHIASIKDDRADTTGIGTLRLGFTSKLTKVTLENGVAASLSDFLANNLSSDNNTTPISIHIEKLTIAEKPGGRKETELSMALVFYRGDTKLVEFTGGVTRQAAGLDVSASYLELLVRQALENGIKNFGQWWENNKEVVNAPATTEINVSFERTTDDTDHIIFSNRQPLTYADFRSQPDDLSMASAATYSVIAMKYSYQQLNNKTTINVIIIPYFDKTRSWFKARDRNTRVLSHEQLHFDIAAIKACELSAAIKKETLTGDNFTKRLDMLHKQVMRALEQEENLYDKETNHGIIATRQEQWYSRVKQDLAQQDCYPQ